MMLPPDESDTKPVKMRITNYCHGGARLLVGVLFLVGGLLIGMRGWFLWGAWTFGVGLQPMIGLIDWLYAIMYAIVVIMVVRSGWRQVFRRAVLWTEWGNEVLVRRVLAADWYAWSSVIRLEFQEVSLPDRWFRLPGPLVSSRTHRTLVVTLANGKKVRVIVDGEQETQLRALALVHERAVSVSRPDAPNLHADASPQADRLKRLLEALRSDDFGERATAARSLGSTGGPRAVEALLEALRDRDPSVRGAAARALGRIGAPEGIEPLVEAVGDADEFVRLAVVDALGEIGDPRAILPLSNVLGDPDPRIRRLVVHALAQTEDPAAEPALRAALDDADREVRLKAQAALAAREENA